MNIEMASPDQFIPELPGWQERSQFIRQEGKLTFFHYDFYAQALAKIERSHTIDLLDVQEMNNRSLVERKRLLEFFIAIEHQLYLYPAGAKASVSARLRIIATRPESPPL